MHERWRTIETIVARGGRAKVGFDVSQMPAGSLRLTDSRIPSAAGDGGWAG